MANKELVDKYNYMPVRYKHKFTPIGYLDYRDGDHWCLNDDWQAGTLEEKEVLELEPINNLIEYVFDNRVSIGMENLAELYDYQRQRILDEKEQGGKELKNLLRDILLMVGDTYLDVKLLHKSIGDLCQIVGFIEDVFNDHEMSVLVRDIKGIEKFMAAKTKRACIKVLEKESDHEGWYKLAFVLNYGYIIKNRKEYADGEQTKTHD